MHKIERNHAVGANTTHERLKWYADTPLSKVCIEKHGIQRIEPETQFTLKRAHIAQIMYTRAQHENYVMWLCIVWWCDILESRHHDISWCRVWIRAATSDMRNRICHTQSRAPQDNVASRTADRIKVNTRKSWHDIMQYIFDIWSQLSLFTSRGVCQL